MNPLIAFALVLLLSCAGCAALTVGAWYTATAVAWALTWPWQRHWPQVDDLPFWPFTHMPDAPPYRGVHRLPR
jgi:hypothetical protein